MNFLVKKCIFLQFFLLTSGREIQLLNVHQLVGTQAPFFECPYSKSPINMTWTYWPVGGQREILIKSGDRMVDPDFITLDRGSREVSDIIIKNTSVSTAGVYSCKQDTTKSAQFIVMVQGATCYRNPKPNVTRRLREATPQSLSCTIKYVANASYVVANMSWTIRGNTSEPPRVTIENSTSANITEIRSTLNVTVPENVTCYVSIYECNVIFGLKDNLPSGFVTNNPATNIHYCSPNSDKPLCELMRTTEKPRDQSEKKPDERPDRKPDRKPTERPRKPTERPRKPKIHGESGPGDKSGEGESSDGSSSGGSDLNPGGSGGLAIKSSKGNDILKCVVGITGFLGLLIATGIGV